MKQLLVSCNDEYIKNILDNIFPKSLNDIIINYTKEIILVEIIIDTVILKFDNYSLHASVNAKNEIINFYINAHKLIIGVNLRQDEPLFYDNNNIYWRTINKFLSINNKKQYGRGYLFCKWYARMGCHTNLVKEHTKAVYICDHLRFDKRCVCTNIFIEPDNFLIVLELFRKSINLLGYTFIEKKHRFFKAMWTLIKAYEYMRGINE
jgi:hypothetical protein